MILTIKKNSLDFNNLYWVVLAAGKDSSRGAIFQTVLIEDTDDGDICAVCTNGQRLHKANVSTIPVGLYSIVSSKKEN